MSTRTDKIETLLRKAFSPTSLTIIDDSHEHEGHAGAASGAGHFSVLIAGAPFEGKSRVRQHQMIYEALADMMDTEIHALSIRIEK